MTLRLPPQKLLLQLSLCGIVVLSLLAGFYHDALVAKERKYLLLEDKYVRVRSELGREKTQELIDISLEKEKNQ